jgi:hypothetical protein
MNRQFAIVLILVTGAFAGVAAFGQQKRPYNELMKDISATYANVKKSLDASAGAAAAADAANSRTLQGHGNFWAVQNQDALDVAKSTKMPQPRLSPLRKRTTFRRAKPPTTRSGNLQRMPRISSRADARQDLQDQAVAVRSNTL